LIITVLKGEAWDYCSCPYFNGVLLQGKIFPLSWNKIWTYDCPKARYAMKKLSKMKDYGIDLKSFSMIKKSPVDTCYNEIPIP
jgi:hypothetical protein